MAHLCRRREAPDPNYSGPERRSGDGGGPAAFLVITRREVIGAAATLLVAISAAVAPSTGIVGKAEPSADVQALAKWARQHDDESRPLMQKFTRETLPEIAAMKEAVDGLKREVAGQRSDMNERLRDMQRSIDNAVVAIGRRGSDQRTGHTADRGGQ